MAEPETIAPEEFEAWFTPRRAIERLSGISRDTAKRTIIKRAANGLIIAAARHLFIDEQRTREKFEYVLLAPARWQGDTPDNADRFWTTGDWESAIEVPSSYPVRRLELSFHDIRFGVAGIEELASTTAPEEAAAPAAQSPFAGPVSVELDAATLMINQLRTRNAELEDALSATRASPPKHAGGKPSHPYWEEAILRVAQRMHLGDFKPQRQADVARALADWIVAEGHEEPGATALKTRAKLVFDLFKD